MMQNKTYRKFLIVGITHLKSIQIYILGMNICLSVRYTMYMNIDVVIFFMVGRGRVKGKPDQNYSAARKN